MVDRTKPRNARFRLTCPWRVYDVIINRKCWHFDAWVVQDREDRLYFVFRTSAGGIHELESVAYEIRPDVLGREHELVQIARGDDALGMLAGVHRQINSPWARRHAPHLEALHRQHVMPILRIPRPGFTGVQSIALHYVWSDARIDDPMEGLPNYHSMAGDVGAADALAYGLAARTDKPSWSLDERARLRTLDKLLR